VRNSAGEVVGVLGRTQHLWDLLMDYKQNAEASPGAGEQLALIDMRDWQVVAHPWMNASHVMTLDDSEVARLRLTREDAREIELAVAVDDAARLTDYRDPVGGPGFAPGEYGGRWLAAARPVAGTKWLAVVQEPYELAIAPAERMRSDLLLYAVAALAVGGGLIVTFWYFVTQALTQRTTIRPRLRESVPGAEPASTS
jgi:hypothetical protein